MKQSKSQSSKIFDGKYLRMEKEGAMYKYGEKSSMKDALSKSVGGKKFKSLKEAFNHSRKELGKLR